MEGFNSDGLFIDMKLNRIFTTPQLTGFNCRVLIQPRWFAIFMIWLGCLLAAMSNMPVGRSAVPKLPPVLNFDHSDHSDHSLPCSENPVHQVSLATTTGLPKLASVRLSSAAAKTPTTKKWVAVCSTTQVADFARQVTGDRWEVISVLAAGQDPHAYEVRSNDFWAVRRSDLCLQNGWNLEGNNWMVKLANAAGKPLVSCIQGVTPLFFADSTKSLKGTNPHGFDPHAWFNPNNAMIYVENIRQAVTQIDPEGEDFYRRRADRYRLQLRELDCWIMQQVNAIPRQRRMLVTHHDAFEYFCEAYGFESYSPLGWSTGELVDVTIRKKQILVEKIKNSGVRAIFIETSVNPRLLQGIASEADVVIGGSLYSDAMGAEGSEAETYLGMMRHNVKIIVQHLK